MQLLFSRKEVCVFFSATLHLIPSLSDMQKPGLSTRIHFNDVTHLSLHLLLLCFYSSVWKILNCIKSKIFFCKFIYLFYLILSRTSDRSSSTFTCCSSIAYQKSIFTEECDIFCLLEYQNRCFLCISNCAINPSSIGFIHKVAPWDGNLMFSSDDSSWGLSLHFRKRHNL